MTRLKTSLETLASRGTPRGADQVFREASRRSSISSQTIGLLQGNRRLRAVAAFAIVLAVGIGTAIVFRSTGTPVEPATDRGRQMVSPQVTLPEVADPGVPMTVLAGGELSPFRYLPDLDLAWRDTATGPEICWTTPAGSGCAPDSFADPGTLIIPTVGQAIILTRPGWIPDPTATTLNATDPPPGRFTEPKEVTVELSNGETATWELETPESIGIGYVRVVLPEGVTVASASVSG